MEHDSLVTLVGVVPQNEVSVYTFRITKYSIVFMKEHSKYKARKVFKEKDTKGIDKHISSLELLLAVGATYASLPETLD